MVNDTAKCMSVCVSMCVRGCNSSSGVCVEKITDSFALGQKAVVSSIKANLYRMSEVWHDKGIGSTFNSEVVHWKKTRSAIKAVILHCEQSR